MKIYENANDQHVRKVVLYEVTSGLAFDKAGTELLTKEQIVDAFLKGCVVENEGNYKTPTGVNVTDSGAELVFGSGGPEIENAIETGGLGWTESEPKEGFDISWDGDTEGLDVVADVVYKVAEVPSALTRMEDLIGSTFAFVDDGEPRSGILSEIDLETEDNKVIAIGEFAFVALEDGETSDLQLTKGIWFIKADDNTYASRLYKEATTEEVIHQIDQKYIPSGGSGGGMVVKVTADPETLALSADKTFAEIKQAFNAGVNVVANLYVGEEFDGESASCIACGEISARFGMVFIDEEISNIKYELECWSENGVDEWTSAAF